MICYYIKGCFVEGISKKNQVDEKKFLRKEEEVLWQYMAAAALTDV